MDESTVHVEERAFPFLRLNRREAKPRRRGITEVRGSYHSPLGARGLRDLLETVGESVDVFRFGGGSFALMPRRRVRELIEICHEHHVLVSTGGFLEHVVTRGPEAVDEYLAECKDLGFDIVEVSSGFLAIPMYDLLRLTERVKQHGLEPKPEINVQYAYGPDSGGEGEEALRTEGARDPGWAIEEARRHLHLGAPLVMLEAEGIIGEARAWRRDVPAALVRVLGIEKVMFEAPDPRTFTWYVKNFGPEVNLLVDYSHVVQLDCLRTGIWGTGDLWGRVVTYKGPEEGGVRARRYSSPHTTPGPVAAHAEPAPRAGEVGQAVEEVAPSPPSCIRLRPPAGAVDLLRDGLDAWRSRSGGSVGWRLAGGVLEVTPGAGDILTWDLFRDFQLHLEFWLPHLPNARGQDRANSGVFLQGRFEIQILDSEGDPPMDDGCGALYRLAPPLLNAALPAETWQSLDIAFRAPRPDAGAMITVFHNGILVHNSLALPRATPGGLEAEGGPEEGPLLLQEHGAPVRFRNLWLLPGSEAIH